MANGHTVSSWACALLAAFSAAAALCHTQPARTGAAPSGTAPGGGIWKAAVPAKPMKGEFDSLDPLGGAGGARVKAHWFLNLIDPGAGDAARLGRSEENNTADDHIVFLGRVSVPSLRLGVAVLSDQRYALGQAVIDPAHHGRIALEQVA